MLNKASAFLQNIRAAEHRRAISPIVQTAARACNSQALTSAGLVISAPGSVLAKTGAAITYLMSNSRLVSIAANTNMPALSGLVIPATQLNVACFFVDRLGVTTVRYGANSTTLGGVTFPDFPLDQALVGFLILSHTGTFFGGTTALDLATTIFISPTGAIDPSFIF